ncbi:MAG: YdeI/OmpD-associated family protein [Chloroflexi bacterium]|nr:YdeI/OmpD-associated family protein [Chloroflexota bacterium]
MPEPDDGINRIYAAVRAAWRAWLETHAETTAAVWLVYFKKGSGQPSITWDEAVEEALCFGWIDSKAKPIDDLRYWQYFSPRKPTSVWSKVNKARLERLIAAGLMREPGLRAIETAKANGSWSALDDVEALVIPEDLAAAFAESPGAREAFDRLSRTKRRNTLQWIATAKRPQTRAKRIAAIVSGGAEGPPTRS